MADEVHDAVNTPAPTYYGVGLSLSDMSLAIEQALAVVSNSGARYKFNSGRAEQSLFNQARPKTDDFHLASWFLYTTGLSDLMVSDVNDAEHTIIYSDLLDTVVPNTTASDGDLRKFEILSEALPGDILLFDDFHRNSSVGIYIGDGAFYTMVNTPLETGLSTRHLWAINEFGEKEPSADLTKFNGTLRRLPKLNGGDYAWYYRTNGIDNSN